MLWSAVMHDSWGGACSSSNQRARVHGRPQPERWCDAYQDCVCSAGNSESSACDRVTAYLDNCLLLYCVVSPIRL